MSSLSVSSISPYLPSKETVLGLGLQAGALYFGPTTWKGLGLALTGTGLLVKKVWDWKSSNFRALPDAQPPITAQNFEEQLNSLKRDMSMCGLSGKNLEVALRRYKALLQQVPSNASEEVTKTLVQLNAVLSRNDHTPSLDTFSYDLDRLFEEVAQKGIRNPLPFQVRFNTLFHFLAALPSEQQSALQFQQLKLLTIQFILKGAPLKAEFAPFLAPYEAQRLAYDIERRGANADLAGFSRRYTAIANIVSGVDTRNWPFVDHLYENMHKIRTSLLMAGSLDVMRAPTLSAPATTALESPATTAAVIAPSTTAAATEAGFSQLVGSFSLRPDTVALGAIHPNKQFVYDTLTHQRTLDQPMQFEKYQLADSNAVNAIALFQQPHAVVMHREGGFAYDHSSEEMMHWTANFADPHLFGFCEGGLLAQNELQVAEHPGMYHLKKYLDGQPSFSTINGNQIALISGVQRLGQLNMYGNGFAPADQTAIASKITQFPMPRTSNIFAFAAPRPGTAGQPYDYQHLKDYFDRAFLAFKTIKEKYGTEQRKVMIHTGNWGAGAFGNDAKVAALIQLAAARAAGVDVIYYPMSSNDALQGAYTLFNQLSVSFPQMTVGEFLHHLEQYAGHYSLLYGVGNGT